MWLSKVETTFTKKFGLAARERQFLFLEVCPPAFSAAFRESTRKSTGSLRQKISDKVDKVAFRTDGETRNRGKIKFSALICARRLRSVGIIVRFIETSIAVSPYKTTHYGTEIYALLLFPRSPVNRLAAALWRVPESGALFTACIRHRWSTQRESWEQ